MSRVQKYPLLNPLSHIGRHDQLPETAVKLGHCLDTSNGNEDLYTLLHFENHLSVLISYHCGPHDQYYCDQYDLPKNGSTGFISKIAPTEELGGRFKTNEGLNQVLLPSKGSFGAFQKIGSVGG